MTLLQLLSRIKTITEKIDILEKDVIVGITVSANGKIIVKHSLSLMRWFDDIQEANQYIETKLKEIEDEIVSQK
jgi:uncharacterized protein (DUF2164 family)